MMWEEGYYFKVEMFFSNLYRLEKFFHFSRCDNDKIRLERRR
jgi:hypothetical protein